MAGVGPCARFRDDLTGFVDRTLPEDRWQQVGYHVAGCDGCRREVADLQDLRHTLRSRCQDVPCTTALADRLQQIAGEHGDAPLYLTSARGATALPTRRATLRRRVLQGGFAAFAAVTSVVVLALLLAPEPPRVADPVKDARKSFSMAMTSVNVNAAVGAVLMAHERGADLGQPERLAPRASILSAAVPISDDAAARSLTPTHDVTFSGTQRVWVADGEGSFHATDVRVDEVAGEGSSLVVLDSRGDRFKSWFVPSGDCCRASQPPSDWKFYRYEGFDQVAGRWTDVLEARDAEGQPVARWWVDETNGMLLWSERYDTLGQLALVAGYTQLQLGRADIATTGVETVVLDSPSSVGV